MAAKDRQGGSPPLSDAETRAFEAWAGIPPVEQARDASARDITLAGGWGDVLKGLGDPHCPVPARLEDKGGDSPKPLTQEIPEEAKEQADQARGEAATPVHDGTDVSRGELGTLVPTAPDPQPGQTADDIKTKNQEQMGVREKPDITPEGDARTFGERMKDMGVSLDTSYDER